ncbi:hypothetical protein RvY_04988-1 [Ramazzottius varieornatus]|uniref:Uncharacterized protein n=1 Tax=Ramazzottius varieornatus TaxID=947166 RepID=A0A1D1UX19_RAMVA|nr:hypothetical protein RvY_04988-1 [Ramazzottius varieornatus]
MPGNSAGDQRKSPKGKNSKKAYRSYVGRNYSGRGGGRHNGHSGGGHYLGRHGSGQYLGRHGGGHRGRGNGDWGHGSGGHGKHGWHKREYGWTGNPRSEHEGNNDNQVNLPYDDAEGPNQERDPARRSHCDGTNGRHDTDEEYNSSEEYEKTLPTLFDQ